MRFSRRWFAKWSSNTSNPPSMLLLLSCYVELNVFTMRSCSKRFWIGRNWSGIHALERLFNDLLASGPDVGFPLTILAIKGRAHICFDRFEMWGGFGAAFCIKPIIGADSFMYFLQRQRPEFECDCGLLRCGTGATVAEIDGAAKPHRC